MIKYKITLLLWKNDPNPQGLFPVYIRIKINDDRRYIATGVFLQEKHWDAKNELIKEAHPMHAVYNPDITNRKQKIIAHIVKKQLAGETVTAQQVKDFFGKGIDLHNIFDFIDQHQKNVAGKRKGGTLKNYKKYARKLELIHGSRDLTFEQIDVNFLQRFENKLRDEGLADNYVHANFTMLRTFFNAARKRKIINVYPFDEYENPQYLAPGKDWLSLAELQAWEEYADRVTDPVDRQTAVWFLLGCYTGLRISDWYQFDLEKHAKGNSILLHTIKGKGEWVTMPITIALRRTLQRIAKTPLTADEPVVNRALKDIAKALKIKKHLTTHCARHTFAITMCAERGIGVEVCAELMGITVTTCVNNYYKTTKTKIDAECAKAWEWM